MKCGNCGASLQRVHRSFLERFQFLAVFSCPECRIEQCVPHSYQYRLSPYARCCRCGTSRLTRLRKPDRIDRMRAGAWNLVERLIGGKLLHCRYCRLQFYDRRPLASETRLGQSAEAESSEN
jgi:DNA-directed RNA polymerase subunit RPC12/RpoP